MADTTISEICELFTAAGLLNDEGSQKVQDECDQKGKDAPQALFDLQLVPKEDILEMVSKKMETPAIDLAATEIYPQIGALLPKDFVKEKWVIPFGKEEEKVLLAMKDPRDTFTLEEIEM